MAIAVATDAMRIYPLRIMGSVTIAIVLVNPSAPDAQAVQAITGGDTVYTVVEGDTLRALASRFGVDPGVIAADNGLKPNATVPVGQRLRIDNRHIVPSVIEPGMLVVNVPQRMLFYDDEGNTSGVPVAVGTAAWRTPTQPFTIVTKEVDPTWEVPVSIQEEARRAGKSLPAVVPPGPKNPLGRFWLGLSIPSVGIHGTNAPSSIYRVTTHGCIRVGPDDIASLFSRVAVGTRGVVIYEPILLAMTDHDVFLEVHADVYRRLGVSPIAAARALAAAAGVEDAIDWAIAEGVVSAREGVARSVGTLGSRPAAN